MLTGISSSSSSASSFESSNFLNKPNIEVIEVKKTFGFYNPKNFKVAPLRASILNDIQAGLRKSNFQENDI